MERKFSMEKIIKGLDNYAESPEQAHERKLEQLFRKIIVDWESTEDIDYSISIPEMLQLLKKAPMYLAELRACDEEKETCLQKFRMAESRNISRLL